MSRGKSRQGLISSNIIEKLLNQMEGCGHYEIIWDVNTQPIGMKRLPDNIIIKYEKDPIMPHGYYRIGYPKTMGFNSERILYPSQYIIFNISQYRERRLREILK
jgi:hypothetical protein